MLHASSCGPSVLEDFDHAGWKQYKPRPLWHAAVGCQTCNAGFVFFKNEPSDQSGGSVHGKDVSMWLRTPLSISNFEFLKLLLVPGWWCWGRCTTPCLWVKELGWQNGQKSRSLRNTSTVLWRHHQTQVQEKSRTHPVSKHFCTISHTFL